MGTKKPAKPDSDSDAESNISVSRADTDKNLQRPIIIKNRSQRIGAESGPSYLFFDDFNRADGPIGSLVYPEGTNWTTCNNANFPLGTISGNAICTDAPDEYIGAGFVVLPENLVSDFYIEITLANVASQYEYWDIYLIALVQQGFYFNDYTPSAFFGPNFGRIYVDAATNKRDYVSHGAFSDGDVIRLIVLSNSVTCLVNGQTAVTVERTSQVALGRFCGFVIESDGEPYPGLVDSFEVGLINVD